MLAWLPLGSQVLQRYIRCHFDSLVAAETCTHSAPGADSLKTTGPGINWADPPPVLFTKRGGVGSGGTGGGGI